MEVAVVDEIMNDNVGSMLGQPCSLGSTQVTLDDGDELAPEHIRRVRKNQADVYAAGDDKAPLVWRNF